MHKKATIKTQTEDFLLELGTEELPTKAVKLLSNALAEEIIKELNNNNLAFKNVRSFGTPRRLAVIVCGLEKKQKDYTLEKKGPSLVASFDQAGNFTKAATGFANSCGVTPEKLVKIEATKEHYGYLIYQQQNKGKNTKDLLTTIINSAIKNLPIPKPMRWSTNNQGFVRPIHWIVALFGSSSIDVQLFNIKSGNKTYGHRFLAPGAITIKSPKEYEAKLKKGFVIADFSLRVANIRQQIDASVKALKLTALINESLLEEVASLVEWPVALLGQFDEKFLDVPQECLITTMVNNQKYFAVVNKKNILQPYFVFISNIKSKKKAQVIAGNEKVLAARLSDAEFFYNNDKKSTLESRVSVLANIIYQQKLGTLLDKTNRVAHLSKIIAEHITTPINKDKLQRGAKLAKADLCSEMVKEFPELQGTMGKYYAINDHEDKLTADIIEQHYLPKFAGDKLPESLEACLLAIADRLDSLVGIFAINQKPTGDKDPFALRRSALGLLRILIEQSIPLDLNFLVSTAVDNHEICNKLSTDEKTKLINECADFCFERLKNYYSDQKISINLFYSVSKTNTNAPYDFHQRIIAVNNFLSLPEAPQLIMANKRVKNILSKQNLSDLPNVINKVHLKEPAEIELNHLLENKITLLSPLFNKKNYNNILQNLADLQIPIDNFFNNVMVNADDVNLKNNRLLLLKNIQNLFNRVADVSELQ